jgi:hypothetical protein
VDLSSWVFGVGDLVTGWGRHIVDEDGEWLDSGPVMLVYGRPPRHSPFSVRLDRGAGTEAVDGTGLVAWVTGVWREDAIDVRSLTYGPPPEHPLPDWSRPPCVPPVGGWPRGEVDENPSYDLGELQETGAAVMVAIFRPSRDQAVVVVAAADVDRVEALLRPQLSDRLCVVPSRWTRRYLDEVRTVLVGHMSEWLASVVGESADEAGQAVVTTSVVRVTPELARWAEPLEDGVLRIEASLWPAALGPDDQRVGAG